MNPSFHNYKVLIQYEQHKRSFGTTVTEFTKKHTGFDSCMELDLIALDIEIRLRLGDPAFVEDYLQDFPQYQKQIRRTLDEVRSKFVETFCPLQDRFGLFPTKFADYMIHREIGRGGMGVVYEATLGAEQKPCAIKIPFCKVSQNREAEIMERVQHSGVCQVLDVGEFQDTPYLCTNLINGDSLKEMFSPTKILPVCTAVKIVRDVADCFQWIHGRDVIHFDIKPSNIMMENNQIPIVTDFGLSTTTDRIRTKINEGRELAFGSPQYMAPEMFDRKFGTPGFQSDVYSLGTVLYELLTGRKPFMGSPDTIAEQVCNYPPARPSDFEHVDIDSHSGTICLETICLNAMQKHTCDRTPSVTAFGQQLGQWQNRQQRRPVVSLLPRVNAA